MPRLRFPGFEGEWENMRWGNLGLFFGGLTGKTKDDFGVGGSYFIPYMNVYKNIIADNKMLEPVNIRKEEKQNVVKYGDILLTQSSETIEEIGLASVWIDNNEPYLNSFCFAFRLNKEGMSPIWFSYLMRSYNVRKLIMREGQGITRVNLSSERLKSVILKIPSLEEQEKIASTLSLLDSRIAAQRKLVELLKKHKRGLIKHLFRPIEHTKWKSVRLGDVGTFQKGAPLSKADISKDGKPFILYGELYTTYGEIIKDVVRRTTAEIDISYLSRCVDVIIPTSGETAEEIATASCVMSDGVVLGGDLNIYRSEHIDGRFLAYAVRYIISRDISRIAQGVSVVHISATELKRISVSIPSKDEQIRIISVLENYDNRILHSYDILKKLEVTKDGLLQQLFV